MSRTTTFRCDVCSAPFEYPIESEAHNSLMRARRIVGQDDICGRCAREICVAVDNIVTSLRCGMDQLRPK